VALFEYILIVQC